ncbi:hypothetical protein M426DRAFT_24022 [Hypoxylon sp. CI-4A]|nr:hypothetical protein M426DRAFT_24022 [Hypoxylon sp. CI-4A]
MSPLPIDKAATTSASLLARAAIHFLAMRDDDDTDAKCHPRPDIDLCEKPNAASDSTTIVLGTIGGFVLVATLSTLAFLHIRRQRRDKREWPKSSQELEDYGMGPMPVGNAPPKPKNAYRPPRVDNDDDADNGHLPPPGRRDSLSSLARSIRGNPDAYKPRRDDTSNEMKAVEPASQL